MKQIVISVETQYLIVGIICLGAILWMIFSARRRSRKKGGSCCGCSLNQTCAKSKVTTRKK